MLTDQDVVVARRRLLSLHYQAGCGHIGGNLSALDAMLLTHHEFIGDDDRFILSKGHAAGALYVTLWSQGRLAEAELQTFYKDGTRLAAHPPPAGVPGIEFATGSLGHGLSLASGLALSNKLRRAPGRVFCLTSDGEWQEGSTWEALIFAAHHRLGALTVMIDSNGLQGFGSVDEVASMGDLEQRLRPFGVEVSEVDGHDLAALRRVLAKRFDRPHFIVMKTTKGHGVSFMEGRMEWHYLPMNEQQYNQALAEAGAA